jgi:hypothetical protein
MSLKYPLENASQITELDFLDLIKQVFEATESEDGRKPTIEIINDNELYFEFDNNIFHVTVRKPNLQ